MKKKWSEERLEEEILKLMNIHDLSDFPTRSFLEGIGRSDLFNAIARHGGFIKMAKKMGIPNKNYDLRKWTEEKIENQLREFIKENSLTEMPSKPDLNRAGLGKLATAMNRKQSMEWWAEKVGLPMKESETLKGNKYELIIKQKIEEFSNHLQVKKMSRRHPYDLLVNECVKVDVKVAAPHFHFGPRAHTFALNKKYATCDIYVCVALDEKEEIENIFIIPARSVQIVTLNIATNSKYNKFIDNWILIYSLVNAYEQTLSRHRLG